MRRALLLTLTLALLLAAVPTAGAAVRHVIRGAGFGHGIGMSQYGAYGYALKGREFDEILAHYYKGTRLTTAPARAGSELRDERPLPRRHRAAHRGLRRDRDQRARPRHLRARRGGRRDAQLVATRGAQGAGGGGAHLRAPHTQDHRPVRPVPRHPLAGLP